MRLQSQATDDHSRTYEASHRIRMRYYSTQNTAKENVKMYTNKSNVEVIQKVVVSL